MIVGVHLFFVLISFLFFFLLLGNCSWRNYVSSWRYIWSLLHFDNRSVPLFCRNRVKRLKKSFTPMLGTQRAWRLYMLPLFEDSTKWQACCYDEEHKQMSRTTLSGEHHCILPASTIIQGYEACARSDAWFQMQCLLWKCAKQYTLFQNGGQ